MSPFHVAQWSGDPKAECSELELCFSFMAAKFLTTDRRNVQSQSKQNHSGDSGKEQEMVEPASFHAIKGKFELNEDKFIPLTLIT